jgi:hypothetical protein
MNGVSKENSFSNLMSGKKKREESTDGLSPQPF